MQRTHRYMGCFFLAATLLGPILSYAGSLAQANSTQIFKLVDDNDKRTPKRYYDRAHKDYHVWDEHESAAYRRWIQEEKKEQYRDYSRLKAAQQSEYWQWRHDHPDADGDRR